MITSVSALAKRMPSALAAVLGITLVAAPVVAQNTFNTDCLPPGQSAYLGQFHARYSDGTNVFDLTQPEHSRFSDCDPPPTSGSQTHTFNSMATAQVSINGGPPQPFGGNAETTVQVTFSHAQKTAGPGTRFFDTEMLQLDIIGGPFMIRESPTRASTGKTAITDLGGGLYRIDSFFDVFTELSLDGGQTWHPSTDTAGNPFAGRVGIPGTVASKAMIWSEVKSLYKTP
jgi:hypothetical protein